MTLHPRAFFFWSDGYGAARMPITWWPLLQPLYWYRSYMALEYVIECDRFEVAITEQALLAADSHQHVVEVVYGAVVRLGHAVADHHQGLYARNLRKAVDNRGYLLPFPAWLNRDR